MRTETIVLLCVSALFLIPPTTSMADGEAVESSLDELVALRAAAEQKRRDAKLSPIVQAGVQCSEWYAIGPFKDSEYGVFAREFATVFGPEKDVLERAGRLAQLDKSYESVSVPGAMDGRRNWVAHPEWTDGYYNQLPSGPPPGSNEVVYLYRTISCVKPVELRGCLVTLDAAKVWLNGKAILNAPIQKVGKQCFLQKSFKIPLVAGDNRLLIKITKCYQQVGFSFAIDGLHPVHPLLKEKIKGVKGGLGATFYNNQMVKDRINLYNNFKLNFYENHITLMPN